MMEAELGRAYAVNTLARITLVCVLAQILALRNVDGVGWDDLVERVRCAGEEFASIAMAEACQHVVLCRSTGTRYHRM
jgi:hypothetical protein